MLPFGAQTWKLCARSGRDDENRVAFGGDRSRARMWLLPVKNDATRMRVIRATLARETGRDVSRMSNDAVVDAIADLLARGRLYIHADPPQLASAAPAAPEPAPAPPPRPPRQGLAAPAPFRAPAPTFPAGVNLSQQAAVLVTAAAQGAPFCPM